MSDKQRKERQPKPAPEQDPRTHSREIWGKFQEKLVILKGFQSELSGRLQGATRGSSYANQLELAYDERFGGEQAVKDALFSRHFSFKQAIPFAILGAVALLYYTHEGAVDNALYWGQANVIFLALLAVLAYAGVRSMGLLKR
ncbi:MAG: hypothetical protein JRN17_05530 [Nitrososphaerota archaeon]|nr:hypothetical protein [Nitrososphaerota archaeon]MDG7012532.1 hypothetical protein [Nitrososphaerota archaeon]